MSTVLHKVKKNNREKKFKESRNHCKMQQIEDATSTKKIG